MRPLASVPVPRSAKGPTETLTTMPEAVEWPAASPITTERLRLEPLRVEHAREAVAVLNDVRLHRWIGGAPHSLEELEALYRRQSAGQSPDGTRGWLNWVLRRVADAQLLGTVQATLSQVAAADRFEAELAWVVGWSHQGNGYAREAALAVALWLRRHGAVRLVAHIHPENAASAAIARALGLTETPLTCDGEVRWITSLATT